MLTFQNLMILLRSVLKLRAAVMTSSMRSQFSLPSALSPKERLIWVDCEMTGLDIETDKLLEIAVIVTEGDTLATVGRLTSPGPCLSLSSCQERLRVSSSTARTSSWTT